jgi:hypothetical protein
VYEDNFPPLTFADLSKAVQRESWGGLGQVPDDSGADVLNGLPVQSAASNAALNSLANTQASNLISPYYVNILGLQIPTQTLAIGGIAVAALLLFSSMGGRRR